MKDARWSSWSWYSECSATCNQGVQTRTRSCSTPRWGGREDCEGDAEEVTECKIKDCQEEEEEEEEVKVTPTNVFLYLQTFLGGGRIPCSGSESPGNIEMFTLNFKAWKILVKVYACL